VHRLAPQIQVLSYCLRPLQLLMTASEYNPQHISKPTVVAADKLQTSFSHDAALWLVPGFLNLSHPAKREIRYTRPCRIASL
jgi:hypothetical protein